jgi:hypothetical protein
VTTQTTLDRSYKFRRLQAFGGRPARRKITCAMVNGWYIESRPNSFAEQYRWIAVATDAEGYLTAKHGFQTKRGAVAFAKANTPPVTREPLQFFIATGGAQ